MSMVRGASGDDGRNSFWGVRVQSAFDCSAGNAPLSLHFACRVCWTFSLNLTLFLSSVAFLSLTVSLFVSVYFLLSHPIAGSRINSTETAGFALWSQSVTLYVVMQEYVVSGVKLRFCTNSPLCRSLRALLKYANMGGVERFSCVIKNCIYSCQNNGINVVCSEFIFVVFFTLPSPPHGLVTVSHKDG